jgi:hypothetical protein
MICWMTASCSVLGMICVVIPNGFLLVEGVTVIFASASPIGAFNRLVLKDLQSGCDLVPNLGHQHWSRYQCIFM